MLLKKILWISRHQMTAAQEADLWRRLGEEGEILPWRSTVTDLTQLLPLIQSADVIAAVLPTPLLAQLVKLAENRPVIQAASGRQSTGKYRILSDGRQEEEFEFVHKGWEVIRELHWHSEPFMQN